MTTNDKHKWYVIIGMSAALIIGLALRYWDVTDGWWTPNIWSWLTRDWF